MWTPNAFDEREIPPMSAEMFSALVTARLRPLHEIELQSGKGLQLKLRVRGQETTARLDRFYDRYRSNPNALAPVIDALIEALLNGSPSEKVGNAAFEKVRAILLPRLITAQQWMSKRDQGLRLVVRSIVQDLGATLILDHTDSMEYVGLDDIPAWEIDAGTAYEIATENLEQLPEQGSVSVNGQAEETLLIDRGTNVTARILVRSRLQHWQARVMGNLVLGMPTYDLLLGFSDTHPAFADLRAQIAEDAQNSPNGLLPHLLLVREGALELLA